MDEREEKAAKLREAAQKAKDKAKEEAEAQKDTFSLSSVADAVEKVRDVLQGNFKTLAVMAEKWQGALTPKLPQTVTQVAQPQAQQTPPSLPTPQTTPAPPSPTPPSLPTQAPTLPTSTPPALPTQQTTPTASTPPSLPTSPPVNLPTPQTAPQTPQTPIPAPSAPAGAGAPPGAAQATGSMAAGIGSFVMGVGRLAAGALTLATGFADLVNKVKDTAIGFLEAQRKLAEVSGGMAGLFAKWDVFNIGLDQRKGDMLAKSGGLAFLESGLEKLLTTIAPFQVAFTNLVGGALGVIVRAIDFIIRLFEELLKLVAKGFDYIPFIGGKLAKHVNDILEEIRGKDGGNDLTDWVVRQGNAYGERIRFMPGPARA